MTDPAKTGLRCGFADPNLDRNPASNLGLAYISGAVEAFPFTMRKFAYEVYAVVCRHFTVLTSRRQPVRARRRQRRRVRAARLVWAAPEHKGHPRRKGRPRPAAGRPVAREKGSEGPMLFLGQFARQVCAAERGTVVDGEWTDTEWVALSV